MKGRNERVEYTPGPSVGRWLEPTPEEAGGTKPVRWQGLAPTRNGYERRTGVRAIPYPYHTHSPPGRRLFRTPQPSRRCSGQNTIAEKRAGAPLWCENPGPANDRQSIAAYGPEPLEIVPPSHVFPKGDIIIT
jgi:hypothetical protein